MIDSFAWILSTYNPIVLCFSEGDVAVECLSPFRPGRKGMAGAVEGSKTKVRGSPLKIHSDSPFFLL